MESSYIHPNLAELELALRRLADNHYHEMAEAEGYEVSNQDEDAFHFPRQKIRRKEEHEDWCIYYEVDITIGVKGLIRRERGFYPEIPLVIQTAAHLKEYRMDWDHYRFIYEDLEDNLPYKDAGLRIQELLPVIFSKHKKWDRAYITQHGENEAEFKARLQKEKQDEETDTN